MKKAILGTKVGMTQMFREDGTMIPVTVLTAGPCPVVQVKTVERDGYEAVQVAYKSIREKLSTKPMLGHFKKAGVEGAYRYTREFKFEDTASYEVGQVIDASIFANGDKVDVTGTSKGKGFQGNIKRWNQARGRKTHGSHSYRVAGSMGACTYPGEVFKTKRLPGHMGQERVTVQNLEIVRVDAERNLLLVKGAIPGANGGMVIVKETVK
ncbi:MAG: 50S ribosomal protein L3 [Clostridia bacterium]|nr:50S ribosomal protein L3 [Clostridia bacterium]